MISGNRRPRPRRPLQICASLFARAGHFDQAADDAVGRSVGLGPHPDPDAVGAEQVVRELERDVGDVDGVTLD